MNTIQLAQRLAQRLAVDDSANLAAEPALDVLSAMNAGVTALYRELPGIYRRATLSFTLRAPESVTATFTAQYGKSVAPATFTSAMMGCTLRFDSGAADTQITGTESVLDNFLGATLVQPGKVYYDAVPIQDVIERIVGHIRLYGGARQAPTPLYRVEGLRAGRGLYGGVFGFGEGTIQYTEAAYPYELSDVGQAGRPRYYYLDPVGASQGGEPEFLLRVFPLPLVDYTIRLEAELGPARITFEQLSSAAKVKVPENLVEDVLIPLCEEALALSSFWRDQGQLNAVMNRAALARASKIPYVARDLAPARHRIGTPCGY